MPDTRTQARLDQEDAKVAEIIRRHGWFIQYVGGVECEHPECSDGLSFAYTIGLFGLGHPELLIFSVPPSTAAAVLNNLGGRIRSGENLVAGQLISVRGWSPRVVAEEVPNPGEIVFSANRHYLRPPEFSVPVLQLSYDDARARFPWEDGYSAPELQPRPGTFRS